MDPRQLQCPLAVFFYVFHALVNESRYSKNSFSRLRVSRHLSWLQMISNQNTYLQLAYITINRSLHMYNDNLLVRPSPKRVQPLCDIREKLLPDRRNAHNMPWCLHLVVAKGRFSACMWREKTQKDVLHFINRYYFDCNITIHMLKLNLVWYWLGLGHFTSSGSPVITSNKIGWIRFWNETYRRTESVTSGPAHSQVEEERRLEVGSAGDILRGMNSIDHSVTSTRLLLINSAFILWIRCHLSRWISTLALWPQWMG